MIPALICYHYCEFRSEYPIYLRNSQHLLRKELLISSVVGYNSVDSGHYNTTRLGTIFKINSSQQERSFYASGTNYD